MATPDEMAKARRRAAKTAARLFDHFDRTRRSVLTDVCREFYPVGVAGLANPSGETADGEWLDEKHKLLTTAPVTMLRNGACGFKSHLTPNAGGWFRFKPAGEGAVPQDALDRLAQAVERLFDRSRAYDALYKLYEHLLVAGFGCMLVTRHPADGARVRTLRLGTYALGVDTDGDVCRMARKFSYTAEQIAEAFGTSTMSEKMRLALEKGDADARWTIWNLVEPNATGDRVAYDPTARALELSGEMVFRSLYWAEEAKDADPNGGVLDARGFSVRPIIAPRLDRELGDVYGRGRGLDALYAARGAQSFQYDILGVSGLKGKPPLVVASDFKDEGFRAGRGGINYARFGEQRGALAYPVFPQPPDTGDLRENRRDALQEISECFFNSSFATIDALKNNPGVKTATEVDNLVRENMERLGPIVMNLERELLDPLLSAMARHAIATCQAPLTREDCDTITEADVEYVSRLHMAANAKSIGDIDAWVQRIGSLADAKPEVADNINADGLAAEYAERLGVPAAVRNAPEAVAAIREARARQAQAAQAQAALKGVSDAAAKIGGVPTDGAHGGGMVAEMIKDRAGGEA